MANRRSEDEAKKTGNFSMRLEDDLKTAASEIFKRYDLTTSAAIRMFLIQTIECDGLPFNMQPFEPPKEEHRVNGCQPKPMSPMDAEYRDKADAVCRELGITLDQAVNMLIRSIARRNKLPAELTALPTKENES